MSAAQGFTWGSIALTFIGAILASYAASTVPVPLAKKMGTWWGVSTVPAKFVLEQKAYSAGALVAICVAFLLQLLSLAELPIRDGRSIVMLSVLFALALGLFVRARRNAFVGSLQRDMARLRTGSGQLRDVASVTSPTEPMESVEVIGRFYDCPRGRGEGEAEYRTRLSQKIQHLAV